MALTLAWKNLPAQSPDFNVIQHLLGDLEQYSKSYCLISVSDLSFNISLTFQILPIAGAKAFPEEKSLLLQQMPMVLE